MRNLEILTNKTLAKACSVCLATGTGAPRSKKASALPVHKSLCCILFIKRLPKAQPTGGLSALDKATTQTIYNKLILSLDKQYWKL